ncbi:MAG: FAD-dependent monooxygenase, partial [Gemmatimonadota bacterium]
LLLDDSPAGAFRVGEALPPVGGRLLRELGVLDRFLADGHLPCHGNLSAWGSPALLGTDFLFGVDGHGWHLDRARFDALLRDAARDAGAEVRSCTRLAGAEPDGSGGWRLTLSDSGAAEEVGCGWLVDATGRRAAVARRQGAARLYDDALVAFYARFRPAREGDRDGRTLIEAVPDGWWYTALVPSGERVAAFLTDADLADRRALLTEDGFARMLDGTEHVRAALDAFGYRVHGRPRGADAGSARLDRFAGPGWLAAGDAAVSYDPLSSQGIRAALYTGMRAGQALWAHLGGDGGALDGYARMLEETHRAYVGHRAEFYADERRWADRPFWARRHAWVARLAGAA